MDRVKLVRDKDDRSHLAVGDKRTGMTYIVHLKGKRIGRVWNASSPSWRSEGTGSRVLYGFRGYSLIWKAQFDASKTGHLIVKYSRKDAVAELIKLAHEEK